MSNTTKNNIECNYIYTAFEHVHDVTCYYRVKNFEQENDMT